MMRGVSTWLVALVLAAVVVGAYSGACSGGDGGEFTPRTPPPSPSATPGATATPWPTPAEPPVELKVAYISLLRPDTLDEADTVPADTLINRLGIIVEELQAFDPDIVAISEATIDGNYDVVSLLATQLRMEVWFGQANPWPRNFLYEDALAFAKENGLRQEGDAILVRSSRYPYVAESFEVKSLNPLAAPEERRAATHVVVAGPEGVGNIDVYVTRLTEGDDESHTAQVLDLLRWVERTRGDGPAIIMGDLAEPPDSSTYAAMTEAGYLDVSRLPVANVSGGTCCRSSVLTTEEEPLTTQTSYIFTATTWLPDTVNLFAHRPDERGDGSLLYASDHNGILARFLITAVEDDGSAAMP